MRRYTQTIEECEHCGKVFEAGEDYWKDAHNKCYCVDNACGWEDDDTSDSNCTIHGVSNPLSCDGCKYHNTLNDDLCGTCGDTYKNKAT